MPNIRIERYKNGRLWAVYDDDQLVCITAYRVGALEVRRRLEVSSSHVERPRDDVDPSSVASAESPRS